MGRATGFSTIGRLIIAEARRRTTESHQTSIVGAGALEQHAAEPDAEEAADLVAEEGEAEQHGQPARAEHHARPGPRSAARSRATAGPVTAPKISVEVVRRRQQMKTRIASARAK